jgi:hypothetical protein
MGMVHGRAGAWYVSVRPKGCPPGWPDSWPTVAGPFDTRREARGFAGVLYDALWDAGWRVWRENRSEFGHTERYVILRFDQDPRNFGLDLTKIKIETGTGPIPGDPTQDSILLKWPTGRWAEADPWSLIEGEFQTLENPQAKRTA